MHDPLLIAFNMAVAVIILGSMYFYVTDDPMRNHINIVDSEGVSDSESESDIMKSLSAFGSGKVV